MSRTLTGLPQKGRSTSSSSTRMGTKGVGAASSALSSALSLAASWGMLSPTGAAVTPAALRAATISVNCATVISPAANRWAAMAFGSVTVGAAGAGWAFALGLSPPRMARAFLRSPFFLCLMH